jgi:hypothetical protein
MHALDGACTMEDFFLLLRACGCSVVDPEETNRVAPARFGLFPRTRKYDRVIGTYGGLFWGFW